MRKKVKRLKGTQIRVEQIKVQPVNRKKKTVQANTILAIAETVVLLVSLIMPGIRPSGLWVVVYLGAIAASAAAVFFSNKKNAVMYAVFASLTMVANIIFLFKAPSFIPVEYNSEMWFGYCVYYLGFSLVVQAICLLTAATENGSVVKCLTSLVPVAVTIFATRLLVRDSGWVNWHDSFAGIMPCIGGAFVASLLTSISSFILSFPRKTEYNPMPYAKYVRKTMRGYRSSEFAKQTGLKKKEVADVKGASLQTVGNFGEYAAYRMLEKGLPGKKKFLFGVVIPEMDGGFQEIDLLCFWRDRIFVGEAKNYSGHLTADEFSPKWNLSQKNKVKEVGNPFMQNWKHILALSWYLSKNSDLPVWIQNMFISMTILGVKCSYDTSNSKHDIRYGCVKHFFLTEQNVADLDGMLSPISSGKDISPAVETAYNLLSALPRPSKETLSQMAIRREYSAAYRTEAYRREEYYADDKHHAIYRQNGLYTERLTVEGWDDRWYYIGTADPKYVQGMKKISEENLEWEYGRILTKN